MNLKILLLFIIVIISEIYGDDFYPEDPRSASEEVAEATTELSTTTKITVPTNLTTKKAKKKKKKKCKDKKGKKSKKNSTEIIETTKPTTAATILTTFEPTTELELATTEIPEKIMELTTTEEPKTTTSIKPDLKGTNKKKTLQCIKAGETCGPPPIPAGQPRCCEAPKFACKRVEKGGKVFVCLKLANQYEVMKPPADEK